MAEELGATCSGERQSRMHLVYIWWSERRWFIIKNILITINPNVFIILNRCFSTWLSREVMVLMLETRLILQKCTASGTKSGQRLVNCLISWEAQEPSPSIIECFCSVWSIVILFSRHVIISESIKPCNFLPDLGGHSGSGIEKVRSRSNNILEYSPSAKLWTQIGTMREARSYSGVSLVTFQDYQESCSF